MDILLQHQRSRREEGLRVLLVAITLPVSVMLMLELFSRHGSVESFAAYAYTATKVICVLMVLFWILPHLRSDQVARFTVTRHQVECDFPGIQWCVPLDALVGFFLRYSSSSSFTSHIVVAENGKEYLIPPRYGLSPGKVVDILMQANPRIERLKNQVSY
ncbi:MAG: hypothetical protein QGI45_04760 [Myxococcota bacterium]|jgi:hypothetical protein|nr:hypothetical protein [Myxococcota bacterium]